MDKKKRPYGCGQPECGTSTGICGKLTFGTGILDDYGYWSQPCDVCARAWEEEHPEDGPCWPPDSGSELSEKPEIMTFEKFREVWLDASVFSADSVLAAIANVEDECRSTIYGMLTIDERNQTIETMKICDAIKSFLTDMRIYKTKQIMLIDHLNTMAGMMTNHGGTNDFLYHSFYEYVAMKGTIYQSNKLTLNEWKTVNNSVLYTEIKQCFANCQMTVCIHDTEFEYVEGYALLNVGIPIHHAWLSLNGKVIDPTKRLMKPFNRKIFRNKVMGTFPRNQCFEYIGVTFDRSFLRKRAFEDGEWSSVIDDWKRGFPVLKCA